MDLVLCYLFSFLLWGYLLKNKTEIDAFALMIFCGFIIFSGIWGSFKRVSDAQRIDLFFFFLPADFVIHLHVF